MNNVFKDWKLYLISLFTVVFLSCLPWLIFEFISLPFSVDFMFFVYYYLIFFLLLFISLLLLFFGFGKGQIKNRKIFLIYYSLLFLMTILLAGNWLGAVLGNFPPPTFRLL